MPRLGGQDEAAAYLSLPRHVRCICSRPLAETQQMGRQAAPAGALRRQLLPTSLAHPPCLSMLLVHRALASGWARTWQSSFLMRVRAGSGGDPTIVGDAVHLTLFPP